MKQSSYIILSLCFIFNTIIDAQVNQREHYIDQPTFHSTLAGILDGNVMGYQYSVGDESGVLFGDVNGITRTAGDNGGNATSWTNNSQMITASVAKMICAVAILDMLEDVIIPGAPTINDKLDLLLKDYIPVRWASLIDGNEDQITLRHLLNHHSGLTGSIWPTDPKLALNGTMNVAVPDAFDYENVNYDLAGFMTIYMYYPNTMANYELSIEGLNDADYDEAISDFVRTRYHDYVQFTLFQPAGLTVSAAQYFADTNSLEVLGYGGVNDVSGASNFDIIITSMSNGWIMSANDLVVFTQKWSNPSMAGNILTAESVGLINEFPVSATSTPLGWYVNLDQYAGNIEGYAHNGIWFRRNCATCDSYTSALTISEDNVYMAINVNSRSLIPNTFVRHFDLRTAYNASVCASDITLNSGNVRKYNSAANTIVTQAATEIDTGEQSAFKAGSSITLNPGFMAVSGSVFRGYIDTCDNLPSIDP
jgi:CubicO group peptidase (beta-lactamase class C family)